MSKLQNRNRSSDTNAERRGSEAVRTIGSLTDRIHEHIEAIILVTAFVASGLALGLMHQKMKTAEVVDEKPAVQMAEIIKEEALNQEKKIAPQVHAQVPVAKNTEQVAPKPDTALEPVKPSVEPKSGFSVVTVSQPRVTEVQISEPVRRGDRSRRLASAKEPGFFLTGGNEKVCVGVEVLGTKYDLRGDSKRAISEYRLTAQCEQAVGRNMSIVVDGRKVSDVTLTRSGVTTSVPMEENKNVGFKRLLTTSQNGPNGMELAVTANEDHVGTPMNTGQVYKNCKAGIAK